MSNDRRNAVRTEIGEVPPREAVAASGDGAIENAPRHRPGMSQRGRVLDRLRRWWAPDARAVVTSRRRRAVGATAAVLLTGVVVAGCSSEGTAAPPRTESPTAQSPSPDAPPSANAQDAVGSVAAVGDSITLGVNACDEPGPCLDDSWAVGTTGDVDSFAARLGEASGARPTVLPFAMEGATVDVALDHVQEIVDQRPDVVTVLLGANDACARTFDEMTPTDRFTEQITTLFQELAEGLPDTTVVALSVPDVVQIWELGKDDPAAVELWNKSPSCRSLLWHADSTAPEDAERRAAVGQRVQEFNAAIATACAALTTCVSDGGALHEVRFTQEDMSPIDRFHPSATGQAKIAEVAWQTWASREASEAAG